jgi:hypothetical protein
MQVAVRDGTIGGRADYRSGTSPRMQWQTAAPYCDTSETAMPRFNPAPPDRYAESTAAGQAAPDRVKNDELETGLEGTFPASDPVSAAQPAHASDHHRAGRSRSRPAE